VGVDGNEAAPASGDAKADVAESVEPEAMTVEETAEQLRERVYGSVSVLSVLAVLLFDQPHSSGSAIVTVLLSSASIWLASLFADVTAHLGVHAEPMPKLKLLSLLRVRSPLLASAVVPVLCLAAASFGWWHLHTALLWAAWLEVVTLGLVGLLGVRSTSLAPVAKALVVAAEVGLGLLIVGVKYLAH
jgi:hypothetical protein